jgi:hypothetical protein
MVTPAYNILLFRFFETSAGKANPVVFSGIYAPFPSEGRVYTIQVCSVNKNSINYLKKTAAFEDRRGINYRSCPAEAEPGSAGWDSGVRQPNQL